MHHIKKLWGHYLALLILIAALAYPIYRVYKFFQSKFGQEAALIALTLTIMIALIFVVRGAVHTHRLVRELKRDIEKQNGTHQTADLPTPLLFKLFKIDPSTRKHIKPVEENQQETIESPKLFNLSANHHRGKPPRFPKEQIRKAVMKWERRDPSITALTLDQFLAQEFGSSPDGVLLMAATTFYDWRRRILKEIEENEHQP
jgi:hypothetical protein